MLADARGISVKRGRVNEVPFSQGALAVHEHIGNQVCKCPGCFGGTS